MATISFHNGGDLAHRAHNIRAPHVVKKEPHIRADGVHEVWRDEEHVEAYRRIFGRAIEEHNQYQKERSRHTRTKTPESYLQEMQNAKKQHAIYEAIVGVYDLDVPTETKREILLEFVEGWEKRNPHLELVGAYYHADEDLKSKGVHVHLDYIPRADGYTTGMTSRASLRQALEQQGFRGDSTRATAQMKWQASERKELERLCKSRGLEVEHPQAEAEQKLKHQETKVYKLEQQVAEVEKRADKALRRRRRGRLPFVSAKTFESVAYASELSEELKAKERELRAEAQRLKGREFSLLERERSVRASERVISQKADELLRRERLVEELEAKHKTKSRDRGDREERSR